MQKLKALPVSRKVPKAGDPKCRWKEWQAGAHRTAAKNRDPLDGMVDPNHPCQDGGWSGLVRGSTSETLALKEMWTAVTVVVCVVVWSMKEKGNPA